MFGLALFVLWVVLRTNSACFLWKLCLKNRDVPEPLVHDQWPNFLIDMHKEVQLQTLTEFTKLFRVAISVNGNAILSKLTPGLTQDLICQTSLK